MSCYFCEPLYALLIYPRGGVRSWRLKVLEVKLSWVKNTSEVRDAGRLVHVVRADMLYLKTLTQSYLFSREIKWYPGIAVILTPG